MKTETLKLDTPLGALLFTAVAAESAELSLYLCEAERVLPNGMEVQQRYTCLVKYYCEESAGSLLFRCRWESPFAKGSPEPGECLDAQTWTSDNHIVAIGTEDLEQLKLRLPNCGLSEDAWPALPEHGLEITLPQVPSGSGISLHYVVAWNELPEQRESSSWFAVDMEHRDVLVCHGQSLAE